MKRIMLAIGHSKEIGGAQKVFITFVREFSRKGYEVTVLVPDASMADFVRDFNVKTHIIDYSSITCLFKIATILRNERVEIINTFLTNDSLIISLVNIFYRIPICCTLLNAIIHEKLNKIQKLAYPVFYYILHKMCDGIIVNSEQNKRHFIETARIKPDAIKVIYSGIDMNELLIASGKEKRKDKFVIGIIGRLSKEKGHEYLINALTHLTEIDYECVIVGDGPLRKSLEEQVENAGLKDRVVFLGYQKRVGMFMQEMDVIVVPSLNETFGITIVEAFALKKLVIASEAGGIPEIVKHGETGLLFPVRDSSALAERIRYSYNNRREAERMSENAYDFFVRNFTSSTMADTTLAYYNLLIKSGARSK
jgi:glycosyltransferase involved in cell wall biosynthesis